MSAPQRTRRSRSKTAPEPGADLAHTNGTIPNSNPDHPDPSAALPPAHPPATTSLPGLGLESDTLRAAAMLSSMPASVSLGPEPADADLMGTGQPDMDDDHQDDRSSSLSELGDASEASDAPSEATPRPRTAPESVDNDSEAETERLEQTPRKLTRTGTATSATSDQLYERTPSKLAHSTIMDEDDSPPPSPLSPPSPPSPTLLRAPDANSSSAALDTLSFLAASEAVSLELAGKKRKRSGAEDSSVDETIGEPERKRSGTIKDLTLNGTHDDTLDNPEQMDVEGELENAEDHITTLAQEEHDLEERQADVASEAVVELATVAKITKPRKGRGRGKRKLDDSSGTAEAVLAEAHDGDDNNDNDDDDSAALHEEASKKKNAIDKLAKIEKKFKIFREKLCDEQIAQCERELEMLKQPNCTHPEYLAMIQCLDERRASKISYEKTLARYKQETLDRKIVAERHQAHSQYFQTVRQVRETVLTECNRSIYELQRGRRQLGVDEVEYGIRLPDKRSERIRQQTAYNMEVSILSGVAKYVGFPAAPDIRPARTAEVDDDFRAMKITPRPVPQPLPPYIRPIARNNNAEVTAEEQFIEKTPWANPHHPMHHQSHYAVAAGPRAPNQPYQTPAGQRRIVDIHAPNHSSASTIEAHSNPPSSAGPVLHHNGRMAESVSPVLQMKRNPNDHHLQQYSDNPAPLSRNLGGMTREHYSNHHLMSSPAGELPPRPEDQGARWAHMNGPPSLAPNVARQVGITQRSGLGPVSVGNGAPLFGR